MGTAPVGLLAVGALRFDFQECCSWNYLSSPEAILKSLLVIRYLKPVQQSDIRLLNFYINVIDKSLAANEEYSR